MPNTKVQISNEIKMSNYKYLRFDDLVKSRNLSNFVILAKAGIQSIQRVLDSCFRRSDSF